MNLRRELRAKGSFQTALKEDGASGSAAGKEMCGLFDLHKTPLPGKKDRLTAYERKDT
jgi:hypothetical protein